MSLLWMQRFKVWKCSYTPEQTTLNVTGPCKHTKHIPCPHPDSSHEAQPDCEHPKTISKKWDSPHQSQSRSLVALAWWPSGGRQPGMDPCWVHLAQCSGGLEAPVWSPEQAREPEVLTFGDGKVVFHLLVKCWGPVAWSWVFPGCQKVGMEGKALKVAAETCNIMATLKKKETQQQIWTKWQSTLS